MVPGFLLGFCCVMRSSTAGLFRSPEQNINDDDGSGESFVPGCRLKTTKGGWK